MINNNKQNHLFFSLLQQLVFNSVTNCLGPRKFLHSGKLFKAKSSKELFGFLFNDFLLLTQVSRHLALALSSHLCRALPVSRFIFPPSPTVTLTGDQTAGLVGLRQSVFLENAPAVPHVQDGKTRFHADLRCPKRATDSSVWSQQLNQIIIITF